MNRDNTFVSKDSGSGRGFVDIHPQPYLIFLKKKEMSQKKPWHSIAFALALALVVLQMVEWTGTASLVLGEPATICLGGDNRPSSNFRFLDETVVTMGEGATSTGNDIIADCSDSEDGCKVC